MAAEDIDYYPRHVIGTVGSLHVLPKRHQRVLSSSALLTVPMKNSSHSRSVKVVLKSLHLRDTYNVSCLPMVPQLHPEQIPAMCSHGHLTAQKPSDVTGSGDTSRTEASQAKTGASSSMQEAAPARGVRWLDREVRAGKVAKEKLVGGDDSEPPLRTDRVLRSYSMVRPRRRRRWWQIAALALGGVAGISSGSAITGCGIGLVLACIRSGTVLTACTATYSGAKLIVAGVDLLRKARKADREPLKRGTSARVWGHMMGILAMLTASAAMLPLAHFLINIYSCLLRASSWSADEVRFQLQSRKLLVHSVDQVHRASRRVFGEEIPQSLTEKVAQAVELAEQHFDTIRVDSLTRKERNQYLAALGFKLPLVYTWCALNLYLPVATAKVVAPLVTAAFKRVPKAVNKGCLAVEKKVQRHLGRPGPAMAPLLAAAGRVVVLVLMTKPWGLMGERIASVPTLHLRYRPEGALKVLAGPSFPEIKVPGMKHGQLQENDVSSVIPWVVRYFLQ